MNPDQHSFDAGYQDGLAGLFPDSETGVTRRFAYIVGWRKGYRVWVANQERREVNLW